MTDINIMNNKIEELTNKILELFFNSNIFC